MGSKLIFVVFMQAIILQTTFSQCVNRVVPACGPNYLPIDPYLPYDAFIPFDVISNQILVNPAGIPLTLPAAPGCGLPVLPAPCAPNLPVPYQVAPIPAPCPVIPAPCPVIPAPCPVIPALPEAIYSPSVIYDSSVGNNLANTLQLLVVSSLLSNTLPGGCGGYVVEPYPCAPMIGPYSYIY